MTIVYRKNLNRPMSWEELDGNFKEVERIGVRSQQYANNASTSAAASASSASLAQQQVIVASGEADRAKSEADRASEITGVTTIAEALIPFPDVWIPFSDNLRMLAGYGDEIKVGDYTIASQATFSRATTATYIDKDGALKTAAINNPRFEKGGLLIEPQSTNLLPYSEDLTKWLTSNNNTLVTADTTIAHDGATTADLFVEGSSGGVAREHFRDKTESLTAGETYTFSAYVKKSATTNGRRAQLRIAGPGHEASGNYDFDTMVVSGTGFSAIDVGNGWVRLSLTKTATATGNAAIRHQLLNATGAASYVGDDVSGYYVWGSQLEASGKATSYIKTTGAAATRASDIVTIPKSLNNCAEFYSGADAAILSAGTDKLTINAPTGKLNVRNFRGFFAPLTAAQKGALK